MNPLDLTITNEDLAGSPHAPIKNTQSYSPRPEIAPTSKRCLICYKVLGNCSSMANYLFTNTGEKLYTCCSCGIIDSHTAMENPQTHFNTQQAASPDKNTQKTCPICSRSFCNIRVWRHHIMIHTGEKPYECPSCHQLFRRNKSCMTHQKKWCKVLNRKRRTHISELDPLLIKVISERLKGFIPIRPKL